MTMMMSATSRSMGSTVWLFRLLASVASIAVVVCLYVNLDRGLDLTDESYYLLWIDHPNAYGIASSMFGFVLSPAYHFLEGDPAALRHLGLILLALVAAAMSWTAVRLNSHRKLLLVDEIVILFAAAATVVTYYYWWLPTPSYNWLPLVATFPLLTGILLVQHGKAAVGSALLVGLSGVLAFAGKPTTGIGFALVYLFSVTVIDGFSLRTLHHIALSGIICLALTGLAAFIVIDPWLALAQARAYADFFGIAPATGSLFRGLAAPLGYYVAGAAALMACCARASVARWSGLVAAIAAVAVASRLFAVSYGELQGMMVMTVSLAVVANCLAWTPERPGWRSLFVPLLAHIMPWFAAFGTTNSLTNQVSLYVALPLTGVIATAYLCFGSRDWRAPATACIAPVFAVVALYNAAIAPYRLASGLNTQVYPVKVGGGVLKVDSRTRDFIETLRRQAVEAGLKAGTLILDFSGDTPGIAFLLGGRPPVFPWLVGGYAFSDVLAAKIVSQLSPEQRRSAWLVCSDAPRPFDLAFISSLGFDLENNYQVVSRPQHPLYGKELRLYAPR